jgi:ribonuclease HI
MVTASIQKPGTAYQLYMKTQWRLDKMYYKFYTSITDSCSSHKQVHDDFDDFSRCTSSYLLGDFLDGFFSSRDNSYLTLWGRLDLILLALQDCDAREWPRCSLAGRNELLVPLFTLYSCASWSLGFFSVSRRGTQKKQKKNKATTKFKTPKWSDFWKFFKSPEVKWSEVKGGNKISKNHQISQLCIWCQVYSQKLYEDFFKKLNHIWFVAIFG